MKWLVFAVLILAQQPAEVPRDKGTTEPNRAKSTAHAQNASGDQTQSTRPTPASAKVPAAAESQRSTATANDHAGTSNQQTSDEDRSTQRKLTSFTGVLAGVGVLQLVVMFLTWLVYRRQAHEMRRQRHEMKRQRHVMYRQYKAMGDQADVMNNQLEAMRGQLAATKESTDLVISKERARISIEIPSALKLNDGFINQIGCKIHVSAPTPAIIVNTEIRAEVTDSPTSHGTWGMNMNITSIETRTSCMIQRSTLLLEDVDDDLRQAINEKQKFVHFHGFIRYRDVFQSEATDPHYTKFSYLWAVGADVKGGVPKISDGRWISEWIENPPGYNTET